MPNGRKSHGRFQFWFFLCVVALLTSGIGAGCGRHSSQQRELTAVEKAGSELFLREQCFYHCHFLASTFHRPYSQSESVAGMAPDLRKTPQRSADWLRAHLIDPRSVQPGSAMPPFGRLSNREVDRLIAYLRFLNHEGAAPAIKPVSTAPIPETPGGFEGYSAGRAVYLGNCVGCHGEWGSGAGPVGELLSPEPRDFTDTVWMSKQTQSYLFSVISDGKEGTAMPAFRDLLSARDRALVLRYIEYFADPVGRERMELAAIAPLLAR